MSSYKTLSQRLEEIWALSSNNHLNSSNCIQQKNPLTSSPPLPHYLPFHSLSILITSGPLQASIVCSNFLTHFLTSKLVSYKSFLLTTRVMFSKQDLIIHSRVRKGLPWLPQLMGQRQTFAVCGMIWLLFIVLPISESLFLTPLTLTLYFLEYAVFFTFLILFYNSSSVEMLSLTILIESGPRYPGHWKGV